MGISYCLDEARGLFVSVWNGEITLDERRRHMAALAADPGWGAAGLVLTDLTGVAEPAPDAGRLLDAASNFLAHLAGGARRARWAIVASTTFAEAQRFGAYIEEEVPRVIVFNELSTASTWLGVDSGHVRATVDGLRAGLRSREGRSSSLTS